MISTKTARRKAFQQGQKDFHAGWTEEHNPYAMDTYRRAWRKGFKREKGRTWLMSRQPKHIPECDNGKDPDPECRACQEYSEMVFAAVIDGLTSPDPNAHLGGVAA